MVFIYTLPKGSRLTKPVQFSAVFHANSAGTGTAFQVMVKPNRQQSARLGIVISKKVIPRAVDRSYVKRLIREEFRMRKHELAGLDVVVRLLKQFSKAQASEAQKELSDLFRRALR